jgi:dUTP pyrophosphatase
MSNSCAIIDTAYTGDVTILFDNISDSDYTINAGDRIAQLWVEPVYRFKAKQVDVLYETERNDAGIGSTGK